ncbi:uncharacterized protein HMPREF1541_10392 [Cyphellophora europaea CBS 101466]|uniref:SH3 domain-containing protein n=1 Tax=Cyphellophora europaea (strain CBS 101466) TaxID=1220924 RepID=W2S7R5_CYPE1|nr:uncharacterized protein HMPREF1541_10392 [Cyphellophora europaea CBS 101466]ETN44722.1 hypothetical protein HMPREF1541_10392 [Cyphellophora europaea CBS 101466]
MASAQLPTKFPCWCRAVYSWGGETDKDLGFVEGDLIECLNAGDGSWWMGRLRRDRRMMGLFPSNFVVILEENFVPISRSVSPLPELQKTDSAARAAKEKQEKKERARSWKPFQGYKTAQTPTGSASASSVQKSAPQRQSSHNPANPPSTVLWQQRPTSRGPSRTPSPMPENDIGSSPPPPPPPHRSGVGESYSRAPSPQPALVDPSRIPSPWPAAVDPHELHIHHPRTPSPTPPTPNGHTPPMIRDAMDDVMSSLDVMTLERQSSFRETEEPLNPWSPEAFDNLRRTQRPPARPLTSLGLGAGGSSYSEQRINYSQRHNSPEQYTDGPHQLETYVQRMESRLRRMQEAREAQPQEGMGSDPPEPPPKNSPLPPSQGRPTSAFNRRFSMRKRKSAIDMRAQNLDRTYTTKTNSTNSSGVQSVATNFSTQTSMTSQSVFSGYSAGGFSATSAGSLARKRNANERPVTSAGTRSELPFSLSRPKTPTTGSMFADDARSGARSAVGWDDEHRSNSGLGGLMTPKAKKQGFFKKLLDSAKTGAASARSTIGTDSRSGASSPTKMTGIAGGTALGIMHKKNQSMSNLSYGRDAASEMGLGGGAGTDWFITRRDINRSNTPAPSERQERANRCQMLDHPVICPVEELYTDRQGDEDAEGRPVYEPFQLSNPSFSQVDKAARFITSLPTSITAAILATGYVCRPYRSIVQRLRAIFIWCAERISWEDDGFDDGCQTDTRRVIQTKRGSSREIAVLVAEMCASIGVPAEVVQGYLKTPGEDMDLDAVARPNHFWNTVLVDNEWRMLDASIASPTHPKRSQYSGVSNSIAEAWYFLARPSEMCWTHVPVDEQQQRMVPPVSPDTLLALPGACPSFFRLGLSMHAYDTSIIRLEELEVCTISVNVPADVEIVAEVEAKSFLRDQEGDLYEDPDNVSKKRILAQPVWYRTVPNTEISQKRYMIKAVLPGDEGQGVLKVYAGKKGLMLSARDIVHPLALAVPIYHTGKNPAYDFVKRHPTPHASKHDLYVVQPQCWRLGAGETYVFCVRQNPASPGSSGEQNALDGARPASPNPLIRPASAMSMTSSAAGSQPSEPSTNSLSNGTKIKEKPAKLAIQSPGGRIIRLSRKAEGLPQQTALKEIDGEVMGSVWESVVKVQERGTWRALVLADRQARWCVWAEWECL